MRIILLTVLMLYLTSCKTQYNNAEALRSNLTETIKREYALPHGEIIAKYDLAGINQGRCLIAKNYGRLINDTNHNTIFLKKLSSRNKNLQILNSRAAKKTTIMANLLLRLNDKHHYLSSRDINFIKSLKEYEFLPKAEIGSKGTTRTTSKNALADIANLDNISKYLPLIVPQNSLKITSHYGMRKHPIKKRRKKHCGIDLVGLKATPIYAAAVGVVTKIGRQGGYGNIIEISHKRNFTTKYAHLKSILVNIGEAVLEGQKIGLQGNSGRTTAEHLHFEILLENKHIDPYDFIAIGFNC